MPSPDPPAMTDAKHTPGPWVVVEPSGKGYVRILGNFDGDADDYGRARMVYTHICDVMDNSAEEANAALIARAPDMAAEIAALRAVLERIRDIAHETPQGDRTHYFAERCRDACVIAARALLAGKGEG